MNQLPYNTSNRYVERPNVNSELTEIESIVGVGALNETMNKGEANITVSDRHNHVDVNVDVDVESDMNIINESPFDKLIMIIGIL